MTKAYAAANSALLLLDLQNEMVSPDGKVGAHGLARVVSERGVLDRAAATLEHARAVGMHVVHVRLGFSPDYSDVLSKAPRIATLKANRACIAGEWGSEWPDALAPKDSELTITKKAVNPFFNTGLLQDLHELGVEHVILAGVVTNLVVEMTARFADDAGFAVTVLEDCCAAPNPDWHAFSMNNILPMFGTVIDSEALTSGSYLEGAA